jgi:hypothetical protein
MDLTEGSETSANINHTLGKHPKVNTGNTEHSESLKSRNFGSVTLVLGLGRDSSVGIATTGTGSSVERIPVAERFSAPIEIKPPVQGVPGLSQG